MPSGMQLWNSSGNLVLDTNTRTGFILGRVDIISTNQNGSVTNSGFSDGTPFYFAVSSTDQGQTSPNVTFSGTTMSWTKATSTNFSGSLFYGVW